MQHNADYVICRYRGYRFLYYQPHIFHLAFMFCTGSNDVDPSGIDVAVTEDICKLGNVLFNAVKCTGKQMAKIVGKHLVG